MQSLHPLQSTQSTHSSQWEQSWHRAQLVHNLQFVKLARATRAAASDPQYSIEHLFVLASETQVSIPFPLATLTWFFRH
jgi:hypothetical protein